MYGGFGQIVPKRAHTNSRRLCWAGHAAQQRQNTTEAEGSALSVPSHARGRSTDCCAVQYKYLAPLNRRGWPRAGSTRKKKTPGRGRTPCSAKKVKIAHNRTKINPTFIHGVMWGNEQCCGAPVQAPETRKVATYQNGAGREQRQRPSSTNGSALWCMQPT